MSLLDLHVPSSLPKEDDAAYELKPTILGFSVKRQDYESKKSVAKVLNKHAKQLGIQKEIEAEDVLQQDTIYYVITGKRYKDLIDSVSTKTNVEGVCAIVDLYSWKVRAKNQSHAIRKQD